MTERMESAGCDGCPSGHDAPSVVPALDGLDRRSFLVRSALLAAAAALAACGGVGGDITSPGLGGPATIKVTDYASLANVGGVAMVSLGGSPVAIVRTGADTFEALSRVCPHQGGIVVQNGSSGFYCPNHGARFDIDGRWVGGQRTSSLRSYNTSFDAATETLTIG